ncbi:MAG: PilZ domain-containing protein [Nitrospirae bacterium]|nr:PilZ domain-containing protein [Nitrospirota bacterium]MDE3048720.1 PilZ domain-containing protein [Nitrospirota bacterium]
MEVTVPMLSKQDRHVQRWDPRQYVRAVVDFRMIATDKAGLASGQVIDITTRGCGLRLTKPLRRGQYLTLKVSPDNGTVAVQCALVQVQWVKEERAGVAFLCVSPENKRRLHRLCSDRLRRENEKVPGNISRRVAGLLLPHRPLTSHKVPTRQR